MKNNLRTAVTRWLGTGILVCFLVAKLSAQTDKKNTIYLYTGVHLSKTQDLVFSPLIYSGGAINTLGLGYERRSQKGYFQFSFNYDRVKVKPQERISSPAFGDRAPSNALQLDLNFAYSRQLMAGPKLKMMVGGLFQIRFQDTKYQFGLNDQYSYFFENSLNPMLLVDYQLKSKSRLQANFHFPLVSFNARPEYAIVDNRSIQGEDGIGYLYKRGSWASLGSYQAFNLSLSYIKTFSSSFEGFVRYQLNFRRFTQPQTIRVLKNNFDLGLSFRF